MADNILTIEVEFDGKKGFAKINKDALDAGKDAGDAFGGSFTKAVGAFTAGNLLADVFRKSLAAIKSFGQEALTEAINQQNAIQSINQALANTGKFTEAASKSFIDFASSLQSSTKFADDAILNTAALIQNLGNLSVSELQRATQATLDLSTALKIDLNSAATLVGKAANGNVAAFARYGFEVQKAKDDSVTFANALQAIEGRFGGSAAAATKTFSGALDQAKNSFGDLLEEIGNILIKSPQVVGLLNGLSATFGKIGEAIKAFANQNPLGPMIVDAIKLASIFTDVLLPPILKFQQISEVVLNSVRTLFFGLAESVTTLGLDIDTLLNKVGLVSDAQLKANQALVSDITAQTQAGADALAASLGEMVYGSIQPTMDAVKTAFADIELAVNSASINTATAGAAVKTNMENLSKTAQISADQLNKAFNSALAGGITSGVQTLTKALIAGENGFQAFGKAILGIIGDMAIQLGSFFIAQGIAQLALASNPLTAGGAIVAAGIGLVALGTLLKSLSGGGGNLGGSAGSDFAAGGSMSGGAGGGVSGTSDVNEQEREKPRTEVTVNVQGNILDKRESGLALAEVLQEYFDTNDGVLAKS